MSRTGIDWLLRNRAPEPSSACRCKVNRDITATIYSALGIDYTTLRHDDPLARGFEYVPYAKDGIYQPVDELFTD